ncbi:PREDICTED: F-box only protein 16 [Ficedula albicollis]|uniref:F-box only protein 16 n=1 Tax=Ficedula albicollis TaxID=59894 RepID=UPI0007AD8A1C|nr:PREDICTED: F-box only protein 16 [Ficedula albicollis]
MAFAPPKNPDGSKLQLKLSSWTPLNHQLMNDKVFEERRALLGKWIHFPDVTALLLRRAVDFTTRLPRVLSLYIFSFLDPRSLCRCAQVSWHWKHLSELDQLWMLKCLRFGWLINFCPTPLEQGVWKRHYVETVRELRLAAPQTPSKDEFIVIDVQPVKNNVPERKLPVGTTRGRKELRPWRPSDRNPTDTIRYNYLDNYDPIEQARQATPSKDEFIVIDVQPVKNNVPERKLPVGTTRGRKELRPWRPSDRNPTDTIRYNYLDNYDPIEQARQARRKGGGHTPDLSRQAAERKKRGGCGSTQCWLLRKAGVCTLKTMPRSSVKPPWKCEGYGTEIPQ